MRASCPDRNTRCRGAYFSSIVPVRDDDPSAPALRAASDARCRRARRSAPGSRGRSPAAAFRATAPRGSAARSWHRAPGRAVPGSGFRHRRSARDARCWGYRAASGLDRDQAPQARLRPSAESGSAPPRRRPAPRPDSAPACRDAVVRSPPGGHKPECRRAETYKQDLSSSSVFSAQAYGECRACRPDRGRPPRCCCHHGVSRPPS